MTEPPQSSRMGRFQHQSEMFQVETFDGRRRVKAERPLSRTTITEPAREIPVQAEVDVLVLGGGPAGTAAAVAAARLGARTMLMERHNHLGGLSTGGLVLWIDRMTDWAGKLVIRGFAEEFLSRLPAQAVAGPPPEAWGSRDAATAAYWALRTAALHGIVNWSPTCGPEEMKCVAQEMVLEAGAELLFHCWGAMPVMEANAVRGVVFESKAGRRAVLAKQVVDATGDGDLFARAGARWQGDINADDIHHCSNTAWMFAGVDMAAFLKFRSEDTAGFSAFMQAGKAKYQLFERAFVGWRDDIALFMGPRMVGFNALEPEDQTEVEIRSHRLMMQHLEFYRAHAPGFAGAFPILSAPQLGVRHTRRLAGMQSVLREMWDGRISPDEIAVTPSPAPAFGSISIPYGALVPEALDGLLAPGRHVSCDPTSHSFMREIPQCWLTGHAAGVAAALAVAKGVEPRAVPVRDIQRALLAQGAYLSQAAAISAAA